MIKGSESNCDFCTIFNNGIRGILDNPVHCTEACWETELRVEGKITSVVVAGMGGSAIGGDLLGVYATSKLSLPVIVNRNYRLPRFVGPDTLVFAVSYSGNTEETLSAYEEARKRGATIIAITSGGKLGDFAKRDEVPLIKPPVGFYPRAAIGFLFIPTLRALQKLGLLPDLKQETEEMVDVVRNLRKTLLPEVPREDNLAKGIAHRLFNKIPVIIGSDGVTGVVAQRWKTQINENAKTPAYWNSVQELGHKGVNGLCFPPAVLKNIHVIILRDEHPLVHQQLETVKQAVKASIDGYTEVWANGKGVLARLFSLIYVGDFASVFLAHLYGVEPGPIRIIDFLKQELAKS